MAAEVGLLTVREFAESYRVDASVVRSWVKKGFIKYVLVGPRHMIRVSDTVKTIPVAANALSRASMGIPEGIKVTIEMLGPGGGGGTEPTTASGSNGAGDGGEPPPNTPKAPPEPPPTVPGARPPLPPMPKKGKK